MVLVYILASTFLISALSVFAALVLAYNPQLLKKVVFHLVGLSTGTLLGGAFFHLLPEALETQSFDSVSVVVLGAFALFFLIEKLLHWHHCHDGDCTVHAFGYMNLIGDAIHNFVDGLIIAGAFMVDIRLGVVSSFALVFHEIPQELGDFGILTYAGFTKKKAILYNLGVAVTSVAGGLVGYLFFGAVPLLVGLLLPFAAGSFLYVSASDLIPELKRETSFKKSLISFCLFIAGIILMYVLANLE